MRPRRNMRPADMTFTEDEVYGTPDAWDASDEPDAFSPLEMIQPGAEDVSDVDDPDLDAWLGRMAETSSASVDESMVPRTQDRTMLEDDPNASEYLANDALELAAGMRGEKLHPGLFTSEMAFGAGDKRGRRPTPNVDGSRIRPLGEVDASGIAPLGEEPSPQMQPAPRAASLRKLSMQMRDGGGDDGYGAAEAQARNAYSGGQGWRALAAFLDPAGAPQRDAAAYDRAQQPIEAWKMQTARREQRSAREADQAAKMQKLAQDMRAQEAREAAQQRALDIREGQADPGSEWNQRRRGESEADWRARQQYEEERARRQFDYEAAEKLKRARAAGGGGGGGGGSGDAMVSLYMGRMQEAGFTPDEIRDEVGQLANVGRKDRPALLHALDGRIADRKTQRGEARTENRTNANAVRQYANDIQRAGISERLSTISQIRKAIPATGDIPGVGIGQPTLARSPLRFMMSPEARQMAINVEALGERELRDATGAAAPAAEQEQYRRLTRTTDWDTPEDFRRGLDALETFLTGYAQRIGQGYDTDVVDAYWSREGRGINRPSQPQQQPRPTAAPAARRLTPEELQRLEVLE